MLVIDLVVLGLAFYGLWLLWDRLRPQQIGVTQMGSNGDVAESNAPSVSVIVPARNESQTIQRCLRSLITQDYPQLQIVVVNDQSDDDTGEKIEEVRKQLPTGVSLIVVEGQERPKGWRGKQWACHQGAVVAAGEIFLFTDSDTFHHPDGVSQSVTALRARNGEMLSCLPYYENHRLWEKLLSVFQVLLISLTAPHGQPRRGKVFAIGQYLMFRRTAYDRLGGHRSVRDDMVEDLPLANRAIDKGIHYVVDTAIRPFQVTMYETLGDFFRGWRRNFRAGLKDSDRWAPLEMTSMIAAIVGCGQLFAPLGFSIAGLALLIVSIRQKELGQFPPWAVLGFPFAIVMLCAVTLGAVFDAGFNRELHWKGRSYKSYRSLERGRS